MGIVSRREEFGVWEMTRAVCEKKSREAEGVGASDRVGEIGRATSGNS